MKNIDELQQLLRLGSTQAVSREEAELVPDLLLQIQQGMANEITDHLESQMKEDLERWFGSYEAAVPYLHLFILEDYPTEYRTIDDDAFGGILKYQAETKYRFRLKTPEELFGPLAGAYMAKYKDQYHSGI